MKSKISFFNKTIFKKNITLYWPLWAAYTLFLICMQPVNIWMYNYNANFRANYTSIDALRYLISTLSMEGYIVLIAFFALFFGMALYSYLYNSKSANMIHSLPVDRKQLYGTNVLSGLAFLIVPQVLVSILSVLVCLGYGIEKIEYIGIWLLMAMGTAVVAFSIVTFCAMFTGLLIALPVYVLIANLLSHWVYGLVYVVVTTFGYGVNNLEALTSKVAELTSPFYCFMSNVSIYRDYDMLGELRGIEVHGIGILCIYLFVSIILYVLAYLVYKKRRIESAGDLITVQWLKPIFRFGAGLTGGIFGGILLRELLITTGIHCSLFMVVVLMLLLGAITYFGADMLIYKSFHVFKKKNWIGCGVFSVALLLTFFGLYGMSGVYENRLPEKEDIRSARINLGYEMEFEEDEIAQVLAIHKQIIDKKEYCESYYENGGYKYEHVNIRYELKNGETFRRNYRIPYENEDTEAILIQIDTMERDPENFCRFLFGKEYDQIVEFGSGWFEAQFRGVDEDQEYSYKNYNFTQEQAKIVYKAIMEDIKAGTLMKYNVYRSSQWGEERDILQHKYSEAYLRIEYKVPVTEVVESTINISENSAFGNTEMVTVAEHDWLSTHINFGPDCENLVNTCIEFGFIDSVDEVWWGNIEK